MAETEAVLLRRFARTGDAEAFAEIIRRHAGLVYGAALRILADMDRASDVAQDTFLQLTKDARLVTGSLPGWLHRVATHKAIDQMRRETSRRNREARYAAGRSHEVAQWKEISPYVDEGLNELDSEIRDILVAHFLEGRTTRHIAATRGISQATVSRRIEAGVVSLRRVLRRRGVIVAAAALSLLLGKNAVQAAPASLMTELGKMAMVGGHAVSATTAGASGFQGVVSSVMASVKAKVAVAASVAVLGTGSVVAYRHVAQPTMSPTEKTTVVSASVGAGTLAVRTSAPDAGQAVDGDRANLAIVADMQAPVASEAEPSVALPDAVTPAGGPMSYRAAGVDPPPEKDPNDSNDRSDDEDDSKNEEAES